MMKPADWWFLHRLKYDLFFGVVCDFINSQKQTLVHVDLCHIYELCDKSEESMLILSLWFTFSVVDANEAYFTVLTSFCHNNWSSKTSALFVHIYVAAIMHCRGRYMCNVGIGLLLTFIKKILYTVDIMSLDSLYQTCSTNLFYFYVDFCLWCLSLYKIVS